MKNCSSVLSRKPAYAFLILCVVLPSLLGSAPRQAGYKEVSASLACIADFYRSDSSGCSPFTVTFTDNSQGVISSCQWIFAGGSPGSATGSEPHTVTCSAAGTYDATLTIACRERDDSVTKTITVSDCTCDADASGDDDDIIPDDEDGVFFTSILIPGQMASLTVIASDTAVLNA